MSQIGGIEIRQLTSIKSGMSQFYTPQSSNETMLVQIPPHTVEDLFVHRFQTDQLLVVRGSCVLVTLENRQYKYTLLSDRFPIVVTIPRGILHSTINLNSEPCLMVNALLRHGPACERDYRPLKPPLPYDLAAVQALIRKIDCPAVQF
jgi:dTDP-4-dehydrorhamnose 3,5-epimerase-like enzyme